MPTRRSLLCLALAAPALALPGRAPAGAPRFFAEERLALRGYDPVAYFLEGRARRGNDGYLLRWKGALWCFSSAANRSRFEAAPRRFAPAYGGYCALAVARGRLTPSRPDAFTLGRGRLFLHASAETRDEWRADIDRYIAMADANWPAILN